MSEQIPIVNGTKAWITQGEYGNVTFHFAEDTALDYMRRKDRLYSFVFSEFREEDPS